VRGTSLGEQWGFNSHGCNKTAASICIPMIGKAYITMAGLSGEGDNIVKSTGEKGDMSWGAPT